VKQILSTDFRKKKNIKSDFRKTQPVGAELFRAVKQTDMTKLIVAFQSFAKAPKQNQ